MYDAGREILLPTSSFLPLLLLPTTYFPLAGLSYEGRKHTQIRAQLPLAAGSHTKPFILRAAYSTPRTSNIEWNRFYVNYEFASRPSGRRSAKRRIPSTLSARLLFRQSRKWLPLRRVPAHFNGYSQRKFVHCGPRNSRGRISRAERSKIYQFIGNKLTRPTGSFVQIQNTDKNDMK